MGAGVPHRRYDQRAHVELLAVARLYLLAVTLNVWVLVGILAAAFAVQLWSGEPPCPLCVMQRIALMLVALGPLHILLRAYAAGLTSRAAALGQGMAIIAAVLGAVARRLANSAAYPAQRSGLRLPRVRPTPLHVVLHHVQLSNRGERRLADHDHLARGRQGPRPDDNGHRDRLRIRRRG